MERGGAGLRARVLVADQQVRRDRGQLPRREQGDQVVGQDDAEHRPGEQGQQPGEPAEARSSGRSTSHEYASTARPTPGREAPSPRRRHRGGARPRRPATAPSASRSVTRPRRRAAPKRVANHASVTTAAGGHARTPAGRAGARRRTRRGRRRRGGRNAISTTARRSWCGHGESCPVRPYMAVLATIHLQNWSWNWSWSWIRPTSRRVSRCEPAEAVGPVGAAQDLAGRRVHLLDDRRRLRRVHRVPDISGEVGRWVGTSPPRSPAGGARPPRRRGRGGRTGAPRGAATARGAAARATSAR